MAESKEVYVPHAFPVISTNLLQIIQREKNMWREDTQLENLNWVVFNQVSPESHQSRLPYGNLDWLMIAYVFVFLSKGLYDWPNLFRNDCLSAFAFHDPLNCPLLYPSFF